MAKSNRTLKYEMLLDELHHYGCILDTGYIHVLAGELSWREIMRIVHKLRRKRGVE